MALKIVRLSLFTLLALPVSAIAHDGGSIDHKNKFLREQVVKKFDKRAPGCDLPAGKCPNRPHPSNDRIRHYFDTLRRMLHPVAATPVYGVAVTPTPQQGYSTPSSSPVNAPSGGGPDQFIQCESGGDPTAVNPKSGTFGLWQLQPMHFEPGGICEGLGKDQSGQAACANQVYQEQGSGAWSQCGG